MANEKRLIDANALETAIQGTVSQVALDAPYDPEWFTRLAARQFEILKIIDDAPTVDAVEVVHGWWEKYTDDRFMGYGADGRIRYRKVYSYKCSKCWNYTAVKHKYCPNCGAKMDGDGNA